MATKLPPVDILIVGVGWTGGILAKELAPTGLKIAVLERGGERSTQNDFSVPLNPRRTALLAANRPDDGRGEGHLYDPQQAVRNRAADAAARLVSARAGSRRRRRALERASPGAGRTTSCAFARNTRSATEGVIFRPTCRCRTLASPD